MSEGGRSKQGSTEGFPFQCVRSMDSTEHHKVHPGLSSLMRFCSPSTLPAMSIGLKGLHLNPMYIYQSMRHRSVISSPVPIHLQTREWLYVGRANDAHYYEEH